ncbi:hypothetical protein [Singulisphaera sp. PoT]|uniref:hypothetical protein n=1 Tax=Singulisphaera sp. PoT TaxID=3411797 RepID=UPI003BF5A79E
MTISTMPPLRFSEADIDAANRSWGCNCGPAALSACVGFTLDEVRPHLGDFERRGYMNAAMMQAAVGHAGFCIKPARPGWAWPEHGLARIQFGGPWTQPGANPKWASVHTHWVASKRPSAGIEGAWVYDVNGGWITFEDWVNDLLPLLGKSDKRADGTWSLTHIWEIRRGRSR